MEDNIDYLTTVLSVGHELKISNRELTNRISNNGFFIGIERKNPIYITKEVLLNQIFPEAKITNIKEYVQCNWAAEVYLLIQEESHFTFETIFEYFPLQKVYQMFDLYHEMDMYNMYDEFMKEYKSRSLLKLLMKSYKFSTNYVSEKTNLSPSLLFALQQRRRDINKIEAYKCNCLANLLHVRIETLFNN